MEQLSHHSDVTSSVSFLSMISFPRLLTLIQESQADCHSQQGFPPEMFEIHFSGSPGKFSFVHIYLNSMNGLLSAPFLQ